MRDQLRLSEEMSAGTARLRVDVHGDEPREHVLEDMNFLNYRLADVRISPTVTLAEPDIVWRQGGAKGIAYDGRVMHFTGPWPAGPIQKVIVAMLALRMEAVGLHPFHAAAVRYRCKTIVFLGGESNHGKSMGLIEAGRRGGQQVASETSVIDEDGVYQVGHGRNAVWALCALFRDADAVRLSLFGRLDAEGRGHFIASLPATIAFSTAFHAAF